jgi:hypothetical protein
MNRAFPAAQKPSVFGLIGELREEARILVKQEVQLAKTELTEKFKMFGRNAVWLAVGGAIAYAGLIVLLTGLGMLLAFAFQAMGVAPIIALFLGLALMGLLVCAVGGLLAYKAIKTLSQESLAPEKTLETLKPGAQADSHSPEAEHHEEASPPRLSSDQIQANIGATQAMMEETTAELRRRLSWPQLKSNLETEVRLHPIRAALVGLGTGLAGILMVRLKRRPVRRIVKVPAGQWRTVATVR